MAVKRSKSGAGCVVLFALAFIGMGLCALAGAIREFTLGKTKSGAGLVFFALLSGEVGVGIISDVRSIHSKFSMSSGNTSYYDLQAHLEAGQKIGLASNILSKRKADALAVEMDALWAKNETLQTKRLAKGN